MAQPDITGIVIAPAIGIARLGNSPEEYFLGPEVPGYIPQPDGGFKDKHGRVKRQGARFRIYAVDAEGVAVSEITADDAEIEWTVHLANTKASWFEFHGRLGAKDIPRNRQERERASLEIDPGQRAISGRSKRGAEFRFHTGSFRGKIVPLGELLTDSLGRLVVLAGLGKSSSVPKGQLIKNYANNDGWHDDTSDGPVFAKVKLKDGREFVAAPSRVLCVPPKFVPGMENLVTLYDVLEYTWFGEESIPTEISFTRHIYPILKRIDGYPWLNALAYRGHGAGKGGDFLGTQKLVQLSKNDVASQSLRSSVFRHIRNPHLPPDSAEAIAQATYGFMPALAGDNNGPQVGDPTKWLKLRPQQYAILKAWSEGAFSADWNGASSPLPALEDIPARDRPALMTRAALEPCVGGAFYPGIEMTYIADDKTLFSEPFRLNADIPPGGITRYMACPWQADFYECNTAWWPVARPDDVIPESEYRRVLIGEHAPDGASLHPDPGGWSVDPKELMADRLALREQWDRGLSQYVQSAGLASAASPGYEGDAAMVDLWSGLGFIVSWPTSTNEHVFVETERDPFVGMDYRKFYYYLSNVDDFPEFLPKAKQIAQGFLDSAWKMQERDDFPDSDRFFKYSEEAFEARLDQIYTELLEQDEAYDPATDSLFKTREAVQYRILQLAPFNQNDGAWIHSITPPGPLDDVDALLFEIWSDEAGNGNVAHSHCNLYSDLLREEGIYLSDPRSWAYAQDPRFLDSAFTVPLMELALSQFPRAFYPELLGFTLQLEWTVLSLNPTIRLLDYYGINAHFYRLHVGIDNAASGHGAKAKQAVKIYLDKIRQRGGEEAMQQAWKRIWNGYIAFADTGTLFYDMGQYLGTPPTSADRIEQIIEVKKPVGSLNHNHRKIGVNEINDWFEEPKSFMKALVEGGFFIPGHPDQSEFFRRTSFNGPMYKVFTDDELETWRCWVIDGCPMVGDKSPKQPAPFEVLMAETIQTLELQQVNAQAHEEHKLRGLDINGDTVVLSVSEWFTHLATGGPAAVTAFMSALANSENRLIVSGDPDSSSFITVFLSPANAMGQAFNEIAAHSNGLTHRQIAISWISEGCQIPRLNTELGAKHSLANRPDPCLFPRGRVWGNGAAH